MNDPNDVLLVVCFLLCLANCVFIGWAAYLLKTIGTLRRDLMQRETWHRRELERRTRH